MAFVYKSQKISSFQKSKEDPLTNQALPLNNDQSQLNGMAYQINQNIINNQNSTKVVKGLPSLLGRKNNQFPDIRGIQKQNKQFFGDMAEKQSPKCKKEQKLKQSYIFSSNVIRDPYNLTLKQRNNNLASMKSVRLSPKQGFITQSNHLNKKQPIQGKVVNKNLLNTTLEENSEWKKRSLRNGPRQQELQKIVVNISKNQTLQIKRKNSPVVKVQNIQQETVKRSLNETIKTQKDAAQNTEISSINKSPILPILQAKKQNVEQKKSFKLKKGHLQTSFYKQQQSEEEQLEEQFEKGNPGPGSYQHSIHIKKKQSFRSKKDKFSKIFISPLERFKEQEVKYTEITYVNRDFPLHNRKSWKNQAFLSKTPKFLEFQRRSYSPPPGTYNVRQSIEHNIVRNLLRTANIPNFSSSMPRFNDKKLSIIPGPGQYNIDLPQTLRLQQLKNQISSSYKSKVKRCFNDRQKDSVKQQEMQKTEIQVFSGQYDNNAIHSREQHFESSQFFSSPPFLSGVERFIEKMRYPFESTNVTLGDSQQQLRKNKAKYSKPFNSSSVRNLSQKVGDGIGVGSYVVEKDFWNKKSYNVYFH